MSSNSTAFILAGGRSRRMGVDKAFLRIGRLTLLEHMIAIAKEVCEMVALVGQRDRLHLYGSVIEDEFAGQGPLAGIHAALHSSLASELNIVVAVDLPNVSAPLLKHLLKAAGDSRSMVTVPYANGLAQRLCAVYRKEFAAVAEKALKAGNNRIDSLYKEVSTQMITEAELLKLGFGPDTFENINTPEDWDRMQRQSGAFHA